MQALTTLSPQTMAELGIPADALEKSVAEYNAACVPLLTPGGPIMRMIIVFLLGKILSEVKQSPSGLSSLSPTKNSLRLFFHL